MRRARGCSSLCDAAAGGRGIQAEEIFNFTQDDLDDDDVMLLDVASEVFLWIGKNANASEPRRSLLLAQRPRRADGRDGRPRRGHADHDRSRAEPPLFTAHFIAWDASKASATFVDPSRRLKLRQAMAANRAARAAVTSVKDAPEEGRRKDTHASSGSELEKDAGGVGGTARSVPVPPCAAFEMPALREITRQHSPAPSVSTPSRFCRPASPEVSTPKSTPGAPSPWSGVAEVTTPGGSKVLAYDALVKMDGTAASTWRGRVVPVGGEFKTVFGMERIAFDALAEWKRKRRQEEEWDCSDTVDMQRERTRVIVMCARVLL